MSKSPIQEGQDIRRSVHVSQTEGQHETGATELEIPRASSSNTGQEQAAEDDLLYVPQSSFICFLLSSALAQI